MMPKDEDFAEEETESSLDESEQEAVDSYIG